MGASLQDQHLPAEHLVGLIRSLADQVVQAKLDSPAPDHAAFDPEKVLAQSAPAFAALYGLTRATQLDAKECRARTQEARLEMDAAHLRLQVSPWYGLATTTSTCALTLSKRARGHLSAEPPLPAESHRARNPSSRRVLVRPALSTSCPFSHQSLT